MKSRQILGIHFFSDLLQLQWLCVIGTSFLDSQCSNQSAAQLDLIYNLVTVFSTQFTENLFGFEFYLIGVVFNGLVPNSNT